MLRTLQIEGFRAFERFSVPELSRVNLFVGGNNSGKTSLLECVELLLDSTTFALSKVATRRSEIITVDGKSRPVLSHLFHNHELVGEAFIHLDGQWSVPDARPVSRTVVVQVDEETPYRLIVDDARLSPRDVQLDEQGGVEGGNYHYPKELSHPLEFMTPTTFETSHLGNLWNDAVLTPEEQTIIDVLRVVEPNLERLAHVAGQGTTPEFVAKLTGTDQRVPLASMGDGVKRLLALSLHLVRCKGGTLLVDEIDTGLHHTTMTPMWRMLVTAAERLDTQVFATTHSLDCVRAIADLYEQDQELAEQITVLRVERGAEEAVPYSADEIVAAAKHDLEIR